MAKKKMHNQLQTLALFDVEPVAKIKEVCMSTKEMMRTYSSNNTFDHMSTGINRAYLAGENIVSNRNNSIKDIL